MSERPIGCYPSQGNEETAKRIAATELGRLAIGFVWPENTPIVPWAGGSETYTLRQIAELQNRGISARLIVGGKTKESDLDALNVPVLTVDDMSELTDLDDTLVFVLDPVYDLRRLKQPSYMLLHTPAKGQEYDNTDIFKAKGIGGHTPMVTSNYMARHWQMLLGTPEPPPVVYPPIDSVFSQQQRVHSLDSRSRLLFAGRPCVSKGIYTLLASLHIPALQDHDYSLTCVKTINHGGGAEIINAIYDAHPGIETTKARPSPASMASLYAQHDIVIVPSLWEEPFGMVSVEAQHAGCRVVASNIGGLPETDCGGLVLAAPNDPEDLAKRIAIAIELGPLSPEERYEASRTFTTQDSVNALLRAINRR